MMISNFQKVNHKNTEHRGKFKIEVTYQITKLKGQTHEMNRQQLSQPNLVQSISHVKNSELNLVSLLVDSFLKNELCRSTIEIDPSNG